MQPAALPSMIPALGTCGRAVRGRASAVGLCLRHGTKPGVASHQSTTSPVSRKRAACARMCAQEGRRPRASRLAASAERFPRSRRLSRRLSSFCACSVPAYAAGPD
eukprot:1270495-Rhodomonas_salina.2